jgi:hypothetical protein
MFDDIFKVFQVKLFNRKSFNNVRKYKQKSIECFFFIYKRKWNANIKLKRIEIKLFVWLVLARLFLEWIERRKKIGWKLESEKKSEREG